ncbi:hypothetical protein IAT40_006000 [Kwoniella sp. CBS 6097]
MSHEVAAPIPTPTTIDSRSSTPEVEYDVDVDVEDEGQDEDLSTRQTTEVQPGEAEDQEEMITNLDKLAISQKVKIQDRNPVRRLIEEAHTSSSNGIGGVSSGDEGGANLGGVVGNSGAGLNDEEELERFRAQWRAEVQSKSGPNTKIGKSLGTDTNGEGRGVQVGPVRWKERSSAPDRSDIIGDGTESESGNGIGIAKNTGRAIEPFSKGKGRVVEESQQEYLGASPSSTTAAKAKVRSPVKATTRLPSPISPKKNLDRRAHIADEDDFGPSNTTSSSSQTVSNKPTRYQGSIVPPSSSNSINGQVQVLGHGQSTTQLSNEDRAVQMYAKAVESEQSGKLNDALLLYRRAFKLDDDVDRAYARSIAKKQQNAGPDSSSDNIKTSTGSGVPPTPTSADIISPTPPSVEPYSFARHIQLDPDYEKSHSTQIQSTTTTDSIPQHQSRAAKATTTPSPLTALLDALPTPPQELSFLQADEDLPTPISNLPPELIEPILFHLDVTSIERFGSTCWRARYLTHTSLVWRRIAEKIYRPPAMLPLGEQIVGNGNGSSTILQEQEEEEEEQHLKVHGERRREKKIEVRDLVKRHHGEWRTTFIEEERIRMDGCYIAVCHYIRPGAGEEWVTITHMITYHRFLRFYPDGNVISFLTTDHPSEIVPVLRPSIRGKGLHFGRWKLIRTDSPLHPSNTHNPDSDHDKNNGGNANTDRNRMRKNPRILITDLLEPGIEGPKYEFEMELALRSTGRGRWNKLEIIEYRSINLLTGEVLALALKHQKPFYFSKVRSYNPPL